MYSPPADARSSAMSRVRAFALCGLLSLAMLGGCASTGNPRDPLEPLNRGIYHFNDGVDTVLVKPAAELYRGMVPSLVRTGVSNFFSNIGDVIVALNNLLQGKVTQAVSEAAAQGDRSENAEYIYGKRQLREIDSRVRFLRQRLDGMTVVATAPSDPARVFFGAWVTLEDDAGDEVAPGEEGELLVRGHTH